jgi:hypothetical protein
MLVFDIVIGLMLSYCILSWIGYEYYFRKKHRIKKYSAEAFGEAIAATLFIAFGLIYFIGRLSVYLA